MSVSSLLLITCTVYLSFAVATNTNCPDGWIAFSGSCYLFGHVDMKETFFAAENYCKIHNSHLVHVDDSIENEFIKDQLRDKKPNHWWLGLTDEGIEGVWNWVDTDTVATFQDFQPNDHTTHDQDCAIFVSIYDFKWADTWCTHTALFPPVCERKAEPFTEPEIVG